MTDLDAMKKQAESVQRVMAFAKGELAVELSADQPNVVTALSDDVVALVERVKELENIVVQIGTDQPWPHVPARIFDGYECAYCNYQWHHDGVTEEYAQDPAHHLDECPYALARRYYLRHLYSNLSG